MHQTGGRSIPFRHDNVVDEAAVYQFQNPYDDSYEALVEAATACRYQLNFLASCALLPG
jgi:hypothetical protein